jgi:hypothetical protein
MVHCFSLTTKQHQPAYQLQKLSAKQLQWLHGRAADLHHQFFTGQAMLPFLKQQKIPSARYSNHTEISYINLHRLASTSIFSGGGGGSGSGKNTERY